MIITNFSSFPVLETLRMHLRQINKSDDKDLFLHRSDSRVTQYIEPFKHTSIEQTQSFIDKIQREEANNESVFWVITEKKNNLFLGTICFWNILQEDGKAEVGYTLHPDFHGKGYMQEALVKVIEFGFNKMKVKTIEAFTHEDNEPSKKLLLRNNFQQDFNRKLEKGSKDIVFVLNNRL